MRLSILGASAVVALSLPTPAGAQTVSIVTTPAGSYTNAAGSAIAKVLIERGGLRAVDAQAQAALALIAVAGGVAEFGMSNNFDTTFYANGTGDYEGQPPKRNIRNAASLMPYQVALHVRADSNIKTIADLKGKRVSSGFNAQKTIGRIIEAHLANAGLSYKDVVGVPTPNVSRSLEDFESGKVDVLFFALGSAATKQASASVGGLRVLPIDDSEQAIKRMQDILPGSYMSIVNPAPEIDGIAAPTKVIAFDMVLSTAAEVPEAVVYKAVKALYEGKKELSTTFAPFKRLRPGQNLKARGGSELSSRRGEIIPGSRRVAAEVLSGRRGKKRKRSTGKTLRSRILRPTRPRQCLTRGPGPIQRPFAARPVCAADQGHARPVADLDAEQKQNILIAMSCPCCGAGGPSFSVTLKRRS